MKKFLKRLLRGSGRVRDGAIVNQYCGVRRRLRGRTRLLFYGENPMHYTMFLPIQKKIEQVSDTEIFFCFNTWDGDTSGFNRLGADRDRMRSLTRARFGIWDAIVFADFQKPRYLWATRTIYICHGVAAKRIPRVDDYRYHSSLKEYDLVFFHNEEDYRNARLRGLLKHENSGEIVGMCCLDDVMNSNPERLQAAREKYIPSAFRDRKVFLYAPTWGPSASYIRRGFEILSALARSDAFVIVKPHPLCITSEVADSGYDLRTFLDKFFLSGNCLLVTDTPYEIMPITDMIISDFSSITFEYTLLRKPIMLFEGNTIYDSVSDRGQYEMLRECCFVFHENSDINRDTFTYRELSADKIAAMERLQRRCFSHAGHATEIAVQKLAAHGIIVPGKTFPVDRGQSAGS